MNILLYEIAFLIFACIQAMVINGLKESMAAGMILEKYASFVRNNIKSEFWKKPLISCVQCMSSIYGTLTFWATIIPCFGFVWFEMWVWVCDVFLLVYLNLLFYKKL